MRSSEPFHHFVDDYLAYLHEVHPTGATLDGIHTYDDHIEDFSRNAIEQHTRALSGFSRRLQDINLERPDGRRTGRAADGGLQHPGEDVRARSKSAPGSATRTYYADTLCSSLAAQAVFTHAPLPERARRVLSKLRQTAAAGAGGARQHQGSARHLRQSRPRDACAARCDFIEKDLPRAFSALDDMHLLGDLADASTEAGAAIVELHPVSRGRSSRRRRGRPSVSAATLFERKLALDEGIAMDAERLLASPCESSRRRRTSSGRSPAD